MVKLFEVILKLWELPILSYRSKKLLTNFKLPVQKIGSKNVVKNTSFLISGLNKMLQKVRKTIHKHTKKCLKVLRAIAKQMFDQAFETHLEQYPQAAASFCRPAFLCSIWDT